MPKTYKIVVTDPDQVDNIVEHEIDAMEAENFIAKVAGADAANKNAAKAPEARDVNTAKTDTFEMVKKRKLGY